MKPIALFALVLAMGGLAAGCDGVGGGGPQFEVEVGEGTVEPGPPAPNRAPPGRSGKVAEMAPADVSAASELPSGPVPDRTPEPEPALAPLQSLPEPAPDATAGLSPAALGQKTACERRGGQFLPWGKTSAFACFTTPKDAGKACRTSDDCSTVCLARSLTCAPVTPLYGCNEIITGGGLRVNECVE